MYKVLRPTHQEIWITIRSVDQSGQLEFSTVTTESGAYEISFWLISSASFQLYTSFWPTSYQIRSSVDQSGQLEFSTALCM